MGLAATVQDVAEKRAEPRNRVLLSAILAYDGYAFTPNCVIRNLTSKGAAIRLESPLRLPETVTLIELTTGRAHTARVVWKRSGFAGLELTATRDLRQAGSNDAQRQLWIDRLPRAR
jgi:hypothetical protein